MNFKKLEVLFENKYGLMLPFNENDIQRWSDSFKTNSEYMSNLFLTRYGHYKETHNQINQDFEDVIRDLSEKKIDIESFLLEIKGGFLQFFINESEDCLICAFPLRRFDALICEGKRYGNRDVK